MEPKIYTPFLNCGWKHEADGTCSHPHNATPECHQFICPIKAVEHRVHPTGGTHSQIVPMVNSLANIIIEASGKDGYLSSNDLDFANDCLDKVIPLLKPTSG